MKTSTVVKIVLGFSFGILWVVAFISAEIREQDSYNLMRSFEPISKVEITYITEPGLSSKEIITVTDRAVLDSLHSSLLHLGNSVKIDIARPSHVYVLWMFIRKIKRAHWKYLTPTIQDGY